ncbi:hypothetical protein [Colwellia sp. E2M01]|uniref:hypothetical protein n=1 Tax=Colwellia sp. E2M01 TaxID=2841561 RepID=UPI001C08D8B9|nr:hypothetical protein [Colwellia sp. E2M01]MBU2870532.1 hypothetical protein [Colwellia sp. E2M01]
MAKTLIEKVVNRNGVKWIRTHAVDSEGSALCFNSDYEHEFEDSLGEISCVDCVEIIKLCHSIDVNDLAPEHDNQMFMKRSKS